MMPATLSHFASIPPTPFPLWVLFPIAVPYHHHHHHLLLSPFCLFVSETPDIGGEWRETIPANQNHQISRLHRDVLIGAESAPPLPQNAV